MAVTEFGQAEVEFGPAEYMREGPSRILFAPSMVLNYDVAPGGGAFWVTGSTGWFEPTLWLLGAGLIFAGLAAVAGLTDVLGDARIRALSTVWWHAGGNVVVVAIKIANIFLRNSGGVKAVLPTGIILSAIVVCILLLFTGWKGWELEQYLRPEEIELSVADGLLFRRMEKLIDRQVPAASVFSGPYYFLEQLGFRKIIDSTFMMALMVTGDADPDDVRLTKTRANGSPATASSRGARWAVADTRTRSWRSRLRQRALAINPRRWMRACGRATPLPND